MNSQFNKMLAVVILYSFLMPQINVPAVANRYLGQTQDSARLSPQVNVGTKSFHNIFQTIFAEDAIKPAAEKLRADKLLFKERIKQLIEQRNSEGKSNFPEDILKEDKQLFEAAKKLGIPIYSKNDQVIYIFNANMLEEILQEQYQQGKNDEAMIAIIAVDEQGVPKFRLANGGAVFFNNYRKDRLKQIFQALFEKDFDGFKRQPELNDLEVVATTRCIDLVDEKTVILPNITVENGLVEFLYKKNHEMYYIFDAEKGKFIPAYRGGQETSYSTEDVEYSSVSMPVLLRTEDVEKYNPDIKYKLPEGAKNQVVWFYGDVPKELEQRQLPEDKYGKYSGLSALSKPILMTKDEMQKYKPSLRYKLGNEQGSEPKYVVWFYDNLPKELKERQIPDKEYSKHPGLSALSRPIVMTADEAAKYGAAVKFKFKEYIGWFYKGVPKGLSQIPNNEYWQYPGLSALILAWLNAKKIEDAKPGSVGLTNIDVPDLNGHVALKNMDNVAELFIQKEDGEFELKEGKGLDSVLESLKISDKAVEIIFSAVKKREGVALLFGDHGSVDDLTQPNHSFNGVPIFIIDFKNKDVKLVKTRAMNLQADIAVTIAHILGYQNDPEMKMTGKSLLPDDYKGDPTRIVHQVLLDGFGHTSLKDKNNGFGLAMSEGMMPFIKGLYDTENYVVLKATGWQAGLRGGRQEDFHSSEIVKRGLVKKSDFKDDELIKILLKNEVASEYDKDGDFVVFNNVKNEIEFKQQLLEKPEVPKYKIDLILFLWQQSARNQLLKEVLSYKDAKKIEITLYDYKDIPQATIVHKYEQGIYELGKNPFLNDKDFVVRKNKDTVEVLALDFTQMGSTEYNTWGIGAGQTVKQSVVLLDEEYIKGGIFNTNKALLREHELAKKYGAAIFIQTMQEAAVHGSLIHLYYRTKDLMEKGIKKFVFILASDGRDEGPNNAINRVRQVRSAAEYLGISEDDYTIQLIGGRENVFDRAKNWKTTTMPFFNLLLFGSRIERRLAIDKQVRLRNLVNKYVGIKYYSGIEYSI